MRISDWSSDVCSSDLDGARRRSRGCIAATRNSFPFKGKARMGMVFRDAAARPALKPTATRALPLRGEGVESPSSWRELKPSQIGRASCRERGGQYVEISVDAVSLKKNIQKQEPTKDRQ